MSQQITACSSASTLREVTTVHVSNILKQTLLTGESVWVSVVILVHFWPGYKREHEVCMQPAENVRPFWLSSIDLVACQRSCKKKKEKKRQQQQQQKQRKALTRKSADKPANKFQREEINV